MFEIVKAHVRIVKITIMSTQKQPTHEELYRSAIRFGRAPKKSKFSIKLHIPSNNLEYHFALEGLSSGFALHLLLCLRSLR